LTDHLGSVVQVTNSAGAVTAASEYDPWGDRPAGASTSGWAFTGRDWDPETQLHYYRARYYDARLGRFLSEDPLPLFRRRLEEMNGYAYVSNSPIGYVDPYGLQARQIGNPTWDYNCFAWAVGQNYSWVQPCNPPVSAAMPSYGCQPVSCDASLPCDRGKAMVFEEETGNRFTAHAMRQGCRGSWTSKNGGGALFGGIVNPIIYYNEVYHPSSPFNITCWSCPAQTTMPRKRTTAECWP
jgi:RHS repeat-associated protein